MKEGHPYIDKHGFVRKYTAFVPKDYIILKLEQNHQNGEWVRWNQEMPLGCSSEILAQAEEFSLLKKGFRGDLKFHRRPQVIEVAPLLEEQTMNMTTSQ